RATFDDVEDLITEGAHELLGIDGSHAANHPGGEVFFDAVSRSRRRRAQKPRFELLAVSTIIDPIARSRNPLTGGNACSVANYGHEVTMTTSPGAQNAKAILDIVIGDALDKARQDFLG